MFGIDSSELEAILRANRTTLGMVSHWISDFDYENSRFHYGLPPDVRHLIDAPVGDEVTYSDVLVAFARQLRQPVRYLELGVSVGKNFLQILHSLSDAQLTAVDVEDINPMLKSFLRERSRSEWSSSPESMRKGASSLTEFQFDRTNNGVSYLAGDVFDDTTWERLRGKKFNLIFSDAYHSGDALLREWRFIRDLELLEASEFAVLWDDLGDGGMQAAFGRIAAEMRELYSIENEDVGMLLCRGWLGTNEGHHPVGVVRRLPRVEATL